MNEPTTEAGKALLTLWLAGRTHPPSKQRLRDFTALVVAVEDEARMRGRDSMRGAGITTASSTSK